MPVRVERLANEPILIATLSGNIVVADFIELYHRSSHWIGQETGTFHRITDTREATSTFPEILKAIQVSAQEVPASSMDGQIQVTFVGTNTWINFARDVFAQRGINMSAFPDMESALESVRIRIAAEHREAGV
jgi:hypothetical protein